MKGWLLLLFMATASLFSEEGMWPLNMVPKKTIEQNYGTKLSDSWLDHVQKSCLRLSHGGSASLISSQGLVMTNHHVGAKSIYDLSTEKRDLLQQGFYAKSRDKELKCPNLYADQLIAIRDVTDQVKRALSKTMTAVEREKKRKATIAQIIERARIETGLQPEMVTLYRGGRYHLYLYKRYTDLRLVMCPERSIASFGGDRENFEFPRHALDVCFFRIYENDKPVSTQHYLQFGSVGPQENEPLFVLGHPGSTSRILTVAHLKFISEQAIPLALDLITEKIDCLQKFGEKSEEHHRMATQLLHRYQNAYKVYCARQKGLVNSPLIATKIQAEKSLLQTLTSKQSKPWQNIDALLTNVRPIYAEYWALERIGSAHFSTLFSWARLLIRAAEEKTKPNDQRLKEYQENALPALKLQLFSTEPIYPELETALIEDSLKRVKGLLDADHPLFKSLATKDPAVLVSGSQLGDLAYRKRLYDNPKELKKSKDPLILLAKELDSFARKVREKYENEFCGPQKENYDQITQILFARHGEAMYPDATFTLRLSIGKMAGYPEDNSWVLPATTIAGVIAKADTHKGDVDFLLPVSWAEKKDKVKQTTPFNFISTHDIIGGNSGSPVINAQAEVVGLIFDGNRHSFLWDYQFDQKLGRAISVHSAVILESLQKVYEAEPLVNEILVRTSRAEPPHR
ncbi:MAG: S46 family peptidase [Chlamydiota bacterium]